MSGSWRKKRKDAMSNDLRLSITCAWESWQPIENDQKSHQLTDEIARSLSLFSLLRSIYFNCNLPPSDALVSGFPCAIE